MTSSVCEESVSVVPFRKSTVEITPEFELTATPLGTVPRLTDETVGLAELAAATEGRKARDARRQMTTIDRVFRVLVDTEDHFRWVRPLTYVLGSSRSVLMTPERLGHAILRVDFCPRYKERSSVDI